MSAARAIFPDCTPEVAELLSPALMEILPALAVEIGMPADDAALIARIEAYDAIMPLEVYISDQVMAACPNLKLIVYLGTGFATHVDLAAAGRRRVRVLGVRGYGDRSVAEHALALMLAGARQIATMDREVRAGTWRMRRGIDLGGKVLGIVGLGGIGRALVPLAAGIGMEVVAWNRSGVPPGLACRAVSLDRLLAASDVVSLHLALEDETRGLLDAGRLARMKAGAILVNTARAQLVDEAAMVAALRDGRLGHAALDVFGVEPLAWDHPLRRLPNVTLTPHAAWNTLEATELLLHLGFETMRDELAALAVARPHGK